jgi:hypothetical protein
MYIARALRERGEGIEAEQTVLGVYPAKLIINNLLSKGGTRNQYD